MTLVPNWKTVLKTSSTLRILEIAVLLTLIEAALPYLPEFVPIPSGLFAILSPVTIAAAYVARLIAQKKISGDSDAD